MNDYAPESSLGADDPNAPSQLAGTVFGATPAETAAIDTVLSLEQILEAATLAERAALVCLDGALLARFDTASIELRRLVADDGTVLPDENGDEPTLAQVSRAEELNELLPQLRRQMQAKTTRFMFRALPSASYETFVATHRDSQGRVKNQRKLENELISRCCISHDLEVDGVERLREVFNQAQMVELWNAAYWVNNNDGIQIPKSPSFLAARKPQG